MGRALTLIELLVVIAIMSILIALLVPPIIAKGKRLVVADFEKRLHTGQGEGKR